MRLLVILSFLPALAFCQAPRIFYTDLVSGPANGGQNNNGAFITLYGQRLGLAKVAALSLSAVAPWPDILFGPTPKSPSNLDPAPLPATSF